MLSVDQFSRDSVEALFRVADIMQPIARRRKISRVLEGAVLGNLFFEASTRTRVSFGAAFCRLGGSVCDTTGFTFSSMAKGESIYDTSRVMSGIQIPEKIDMALPRTRPYRFRSVCDARISGTSKAGFDRAVPSHI